MKLIMENWRKFLTEERVCADGSTPSKAIGREGLMCRDGTAPVEQDYAEAPAEAPDPTKYPDTIKLDTPGSPFEGMIPGTITVLRNIPFFKKYIDEVEAEMPPPTSGLHAVTGWNALLTLKVAKLMKDDAVDHGKDVSKEFKYAKKLAMQQAKDFKTQHLDGENADHRLLWGQIKKDLRSLNPFD